MKSKTRKVIIIVCVAIVLMISILYVVFYLPIKNYIDQVPKITPKSQVVVKVGETVEWQDLFEVECKGKYTMKLMTQENYYNVIEISEDEQSFVAKDKADEVVIYVIGRGENAESVDVSTTITIE